MPENRKLRVQVFIYSSLHHYVVLRAAGHDYTFRIVNGLKVPPGQKIVPKTIHDTLFVLLQPYDCFPSEM